ncbi:MAG: PadR family transcriptional regulator [Spirochaetia bacterium]|nr:PadR family transcriptional regulator [Spirochaetia bacterium]
MQDPIRKIFLAFIEIHILYHAKKEPIYGSWMIEELKNHGYDISAGTLYPIFHKLEKNNLIESKKVLIEGKIRKYYSTTELGNDTLNEAIEKINELKNEIN